MIGLPKAWAKRRSPASAPATVLGKVAGSTMAVGKARARSTAA
jgi:hypothetical protein